MYQFPFYWLKSGMGIEFPRRHCHPLWGESSDLLISSVNMWVISAALLFFFPFIFISWRLITLQYCSDFCHTFDMNQPWIYMYSPSRFPLPPPSPPDPSGSSQSVHQAQALVSCIQPGLVICFTLDNIRVSMLFSRNIPPLPSPTESKSLFCTSVSLFLFYI